MPIRDRIEALKEAMMEKMEGQESWRMPRKTKSTTSRQAVEARAAQLGESSSRLGESDAVDDVPQNGSDTSKRLSRLERKIDKIEKLSQREDVNFQHKHDSIDHGIRAMKSLRQQASSEAAEEADAKKDKLAAMIEKMKEERGKSFNELHAYINQRHEAMKQDIHRMLVEQSERAETQERFGMRGRDWKEQVDLHDSAMSYSRNHVMLALQQKMDALRLELLREKTIWQETIEHIQDAMEGMVVSCVLAAHEERKRIQTELLVVLRSHCARLVEKDNETKEKDNETKKKDKAIDESRMKSKGSKAGSKRGSMKD
eukprot:767983-Hanusia_phi.AAC.9